MGATPPARLAWVLAFLERDLGALREGELEALGDDLRFLALEAQPTGTRSTWVRGTLTRDALGHLQTELAGGIAALFTTASGPCPARRRCGCAAIRAAACIRIAA